VVESPSPENFKTQLDRMSDFPGFGQDRVNFQQNPGRDTSGRADPTWPNRAGVMLGSSGEERGSGNSLVARECARWSGPAEQLSGLWSLCCVFSLSVSLLLLFPLFTVLLNCPYPDPPVFACFFPFSSTSRWAEGRPRGAFVAGRSQTITQIISCRLPFPQKVGPDDLSRSLPTWLIL